LAGWPLHEGEGTVAHDTVSGLADGTIENATWVAGEQVLRFDAGAECRVRVAAEAAAQVRVRDAVTLTARIRPRQDTSDASVPVNKEGEYELARFPDGTLRFALANTTPGWDWVDTGVVIPLGAWTHVAVAYDGGAVRTWVDGVGRHTAP